MLRAGSMVGDILHIDGVMCGSLISVEGGAGFADVVEEPPLGRLVKKHVGQPRWEDLELQVDPLLSDKIYNWIAACWKGEEIRPRDLAVTTVDAEGNALRRREFYRPLITETTVPALDAASKDAGFLTLKLAFESARTLRPGGKVPAPQPVRRRWVLAHFRLELDGLDCTRVSKIDSFTVEQPFRIGKGGVREPGLLSFPNLSVTLSEQGAEAWESWFTDFVLKGNNADSQEKTGRLTVLSPDLTRALARIELFNVGIFRLAQAPERAGVDLVRRVVAGLYCERMDFSVAPG